MIPKRFQLYGFTFKVLRKSLKQLKARAGGDCYGLFIPDATELWICKTSECPESLCEQTFWHELTHALFYVSTKPKLGQDETLVDQLGYLLHQFAMSSI